MGYLLSSLLRYTHNSIPRFLNRQSSQSPVVLCVVCRQLHTAFSKPPATFSIEQYGVRCTVKNGGTYEANNLQISATNSGDAIVPKRSYRHTVLGISGCVNMVFLTFLFSDNDLGTQFLKDVGLIRSKVPCNTCSCDMTWCADPTTTYGFR